MKNTQPVLKKEFTLNGEIVATLYHGDCLELLAQGKLKADALVSDPPYGISFQYGGGGGGAGLSNPEIVRANTSLKPIHGDEQPFDPAPWIAHAGEGAIVLFGVDHFKTRLPEGGRFMVWDKSCGQGAAASFCDAEFMWTNRKNPRSIYRHFWMGALRNSKNDTKKKLHVSQKPVALMAWCIETARIGVGKVVLDPFMGSGSTGVACLQTGRKFIGCEIDEEYFEVACGRIEQAIAAMNASPADMFEALDCA